MNATLNTGMNDVRELTKDEISAIGGAVFAVSGGDVSMAVSDSGTDAAGRSIQMMLRRVWRDGALFSRHPG